MQTRSQKHSSTSESLKGVQGRQPAAMLRPRSDRKGPAGTRNERKRNTRNICMAIRNPQSAIRNRSPTGCSNATAATCACFCH
eukprot:6707177-Alexandrium_andersonii.AAC.1